MKFCIKILFVFFIFSLIFLPKNIEARSGCCSSHGGVCGCGCCDGTGLSATCAPYYPECNGSRVIQVVQPTQVPVRIIPTSVPTSRPIIPTATSIPTKTPTLIPTIVPTEIPISPTVIPSPVVNTDTAKVLGATTNSTSSNSFDNPLGSMAIFAWVIFGGYKLVKKFKKKQ